MLECDLQPLLRAVCWNSDPESNGSIHTVKAEDEGQTEGLSGEVI